MGFILKLWKYLLVFKNKYVMDDLYEYFFFLYLIYLKFCFVVIDE